METVTWSQGNDPDNLNRLFERACEADAIVSIEFTGPGWKTTVEAIPSRLRGDDSSWCVGPRTPFYRGAPVGSLQRATATLPPERPDWLPKEANEGDWLVNGRNIVRQWKDGHLRFVSGDPDFLIYHGETWTIWPVWKKHLELEDTAASLVLERDGLECEIQRLKSRLSTSNDAIDGLRRDVAEWRTEAERLKREIDRLSTVTEAMIHAARWSDGDSPWDRSKIRRALEVALAARDEPEGDD